MRIITTLTVFLLVSLANCSEYLERKNDVSCIKGSCYKVTYHVFIEDRVFKVAIAERSSCSDEFCKKCYYKGDWRLVHEDNRYHLVRRTRSCEESSIANLDDLFPIFNNETSYGFFCSTVVDIQCFSYRCRKIRYTLNCYSYGHTMDTSYSGNCDRWKCDNCLSKDPWVFRTGFNPYNIERKVESCYAPVKVEMADFFGLSNRYLGEISILIPDFINILQTRYLSKSISETIKILQVKTFYIHNSHSVLWKLFMNVISLLSFEIFGQNNRGVRF